MMQKHFIKKNAGNNWWSLKTTGSDMVYYYSFYNKLGMNPTIKPQKKKN